ncbi:BMC domain-containing protein [Myxacorys almedinensis]|uniref:Carboxysome shell protein CcmK n=1 Tax=Myxacorys almedinensis A TaxID=2690445 RepID=A0A8J7Z7F5_9CYAN|nr:BMC domain-containing protein [Myxacorys almedinensis]NDJ19301.1 BMC domain-containing protein [Myxacorys almedinensis A]
MSYAVGMVEVRGLPPALSVADVMCKAARVTLVEMERVSGAYITIVVRGAVSEVKIAVEAGIEAAKKMSSYKEGDKLFLSSHYIPSPNENLMVVLPIDYTADTIEFNEVR